MRDFPPIHQRHNAIKGLCWYSIARAVTLVHTVFGDKGLGTTLRGVRFVRRSS